MGNFYNNFSSYTKVLFSIKITHGKFHIIISFSTTTRVLLIQIQKPLSPSSICPFSSLELERQYVFHDKTRKSHSRNGISKLSTDISLRFKRSVEFLPPPLGSIHLERRRIDANATRERIFLRDPVHPTELDRYEGTIGTRLTFDMAMPDAISLVSRQQNDGNVFSREKSWKYRLRGESSSEVIAFENESGNRVDSLNWCCVIVVVVCCNIIAGISILP